ncbi:MAG: hypothetical protein ABW318_20425 [Vicinamibacterales bacterium]
MARVEISELRLETVWGRQPIGSISNGAQRPLYIYVYGQDWQNAATSGQHRLTWAEGLALAEANVALSYGPDVQHRN